MGMRSVTSRYEPDREPGLSASASYKNKVASVSGKASFANPQFLIMSGKLRRACMKPAAKSAG